MKTLALDFAWRNTGWVVVNGGGDPEGWGNIKTKPRKKKNKSDKDPIADLEHELNNKDHIIKEIEGIRSDFEVIDTIAEVPFFAQQSYHAILIGLGWALLDEIGCHYYITGFQVKNALCEKGSASKSEVAKVMLRSGGIKLMFANYHIKDAYAAYLAYQKLTR